MRNILDSCDKIHKHFLLPRPAELQKKPGPYGRKYGPG